MAQPQASAPALQQQHCHSNGALRQLFSDMRLAPRVSSSAVCGMRLAAAFQRHATCNFFQHFDDSNSAACICSSCDFELLRCDSDSAACICSSSNFEFWRHRQRGVQLRAYAAAGVSARDRRLLCVKIFNEATSFSFSISLLLRVRRSVFCGLGSSLNVSRLSLLIILFCYLILPLSSLLVGYSSCFLVSLFKSSSVLPQSRLPRRFAVKILGSEQQLL